MPAHALQHRTDAAAAAVAAPAPPASAPRAKHLRPDAEMLRAALEATGTSERQLAARMHLSRARVGQWLSGEATLSVERIEAIAAACPGLGRELARRALDRLAALVEAPGAPLGLERGLRRCAAELGDVARVVDEALADGSVTELERATVRREVRQLVEAADQLRRAVG